MIGTKFEWNYTLASNGKSCQGSPGGMCPMIRGKALGGSSMINYQVSLRGNRNDFNEWEAMGNPTWGWSSVLPYFKKTEDYRGPNPSTYHGFDGPLTISRFSGLASVTQVLLEVGKQSGYGVVDDFNDGQSLGFGPYDSTAKNNIRNTPATAFLLEPKPNLHIIKNAIVNKINFDQDKNAVSVKFEYTTRNEQIHQLEAFSSKEIIISAGAIESPKLLQLSGIGPKSLLEANNIPVLTDMPVGENLQEHVAVWVFFRFDANDPQNITDTTYNYLMKRNESFLSTQMVTVVSFLDIGNETGEYPNIQLHHFWYAKGSSPSVIFGLTPAATQKLMETFETTGVLATLIMGLNPKSRGSVKIKSSNFHEKPIIDLNLLSNDDDVKTVIKTIRALIELENTPVFKENNVTHIEFPIPGCEDVDIGSDEYWECYIRYNSLINWHISGSTKMGPVDDRDAIVDSRLNVRSVNRLRVADTGIMPLVVSANTMMSTIMIGEKAADFIKEDWRSDL